MDFFEVIQTRRSTRAFTAAPVEAQKLQAILEAANRAPSAGKLQAYVIEVVTSRETLNALACVVGGQESIRQAPLALVFCTQPACSAVKYGRRGATLYCLQDATIACVYAQLAATALGLVSVRISAFDDHAVRTVIGAATERLPVAILPIDYADEHPEPTPRRPLIDLVRYLT